jgi:hypothetical protein
VSCKKASWISHSNTLANNVLHLIQVILPMSGIFHGGR